MILKQQMVWQTFSRSAVCWQSTVPPLQNITVFWSTRKQQSSQWHSPRRALNNTQHFNNALRTCHKLPPATALGCTACPADPRCQQVTPKHPNLPMANTTGATKMFRVAEFMPSRDLSRNFQGCSSRMQTISALVRKQMAARVCLRNKWPELLSAEPLSLHYSTRRKAPCFLHICYPYFSQNSKKVRGREEYIVA